MIIDNPRAEHLIALRRLWQQAFGDSDAFLDEFFEKGFAFDRCRCVFREGEPVAAVYRFDGAWQERKIAYLYALSVAESHRGQGLSRLLLADTHAALRQMGFAGVVLEPATQSLREYYSRLGYREFGSRQERKIRSSAEPASVAELGLLGYEQARKKLLPQNGICQAGALTEFLQTQARLMGGDDFVAAVSRREPYVIEFLGNQNRIPGLLRVLNMEEAVVRLPGGTATSMYLSLNENSDLPSYFGLPMD